MSPVAVTSTSDIVPVTSKAFLDIQVNIECGFTLKCVRDMIITCSQDNFNFKILLEKQYDFSIHQTNLQVLITEIYKIINGIAPPIINFLFTFRLNQHHLRNFQELSTEKRNAVNYCFETVTYKAPILWAKLPSEYKVAGSLTAFKLKIKSRIYEICTCRLCKKYELSLWYI